MTKPRDEGCQKCRPDMRGLYRKFRVERTDGTDKEPSGKHYRCRYFVLDLDHDKHAKAALCAYAKDCAAERPKLAEDLLWMVGGPVAPDGN